MENKETKELDAQIRLAEILSDIKKPITLGGKTFEIRALRAGTQHLIVLEASKIAKEGETFSDVIKLFAQSTDSVIKCLAYAILNDKDKIHGKDFQDMCEFIRWETNPNEWPAVLVEIFGLLDYETVFKLTSQIDTLRLMVLKRRTTKASH
jgi:hypothetical protein